MISWRICLRLVLVQTLLIQFLSNFEWWWVTRSQGCKNAGTSAVILLLSGMKLPIIAVGDYVRETTAKKSVRVTNMDGLSIAPLMLLCLIHRLRYWSVQPVMFISICKRFVHTLRFLIFTSGKKGGALASSIYSYMQHGDPYIKALIKHTLTLVRALVKAHQQWPVEKLVESADCKHYAAFERIFMDVI